MRLALFAALWLCALPAAAQYSGSAMGVVLRVAPPNDGLKLDTQFGLGLEGKSQIGVGRWSLHYRGTLNMASSFTAPNTTFLPMWVESGVRYDFYEDRARPYLIADIVFYQLTNAPAGFTAPSNTPGATFRAGYEHYLGHELSLGVDAGLTWLIQINAVDALTFDTVFGLRAHY
jgi:hypothetical protein